MILYIIAQCSPSFQCVYGQANLMHPTSRHSWTVAVSIREDLTNLSPTNLKSLGYIRQNLWIQCMHWMNERYCFIGANRFELLKFDLRHIQFLRNRSRVTCYSISRKTVVVPLIVEAPSSYHYWYLVMSQNSFSAEKSKISLAHLNITPTKWQSQLEQSVPVLHHQYYRVKV